MVRLVLALSLLGAVLAGFRDEEAEEVPYSSEEEYKPAPQYVGGATNTIQVYHGKYEGRCQDDGFYYHDEYSFVVCSNGNAYRQRCAPGSRNSGHRRYEHGKDYYYQDFCDVNLVDGGYAAQAVYSGGYSGHVGRPDYKVVDYKRSEDYKGGTFRTYSHERHAVRGTLRKDYGGYPGDYKSGHD